jgi:pimeloyl-ACP methyl ester carboxylesterase
MKRRADLVTAERLRRPPTDVRKGAAQVLIERLSARLTREVSGCTRAGEPVPVACWRTPERDGGRTEVPVEVTLVGHSMGAIIANRLLASPHDLPVRRIIYLAPASSLDEAELLLRRSLQRWSQVEFHGFALNRADEARERDPSGVLLPRGTLLVWIDALFEPVNTPARKRLGRIRAWLDYYEREAPPELTLREFAATSPGRPRRHGQLDDAVHLGRVLCLVDPRAFVDGCEDAGPDLRAVP